MHSHFMKHLVLCIQDHSENVYGKNHLLSIWAAKCAVYVLHYFLEDYPNDELVILDQKNRNKKFWLLFW